MFVRPRQSVLTELAKQARYSCAQGLEFGDADLPLTGQLASIPKEITNACQGLVAVRSRFLRRTELKEAVSITFLEVFEVGYEESLPVDNALLQFRKIELRLPWIRSTGLLDEVCEELCIGTRTTTECGEGAINRVEGEGKTILIPKPSPRTDRGHSLGHSQRSGSGT